MVDSLLVQNEIVLVSQYEIERGTIVEKERLEEDKTFENIMNL